MIKSTKACPPRSRANAQVCASLNAFNSTVDATVKGVESAATGEREVTVGQAESTATAIAEAWTSLRGSLGERNEAVSQQVNTAVEKYQDTVKSIADNKDLSLADAASQIATAQDTLETDLRSIGDQVGC